MSRNTELEYIEDSIGFSIENITRSNFDLFTKIHLKIYNGIKLEAQLDSEIEYMKQRLETGSWKIAESYPEIEDFTEMMFYDMVKVK